MPRCSRLFFPLLALFYFAGRVSRRPITTKNEAFGVHTAVLSRTNGPPPMRTDDNHNTFCEQDCLRVDFRRVSALDHTIRKVICCDAYGDRPALGLATHKARACIVVRVFDVVCHRKWLF